METKRPAFYILTLRILSDKEGICDASVIISRLLAVCLLVFLRLLLVGEKVVDVIEAIHKAVLLVAVDVELLALARGLVGDGLIRQVDFYLHLGVGLDAVKKLGEETLRDNHGKYEIVELVVLVDVSEET